MPVTTPDGGPDSTMAEPDAGPDATTPTPDGSTPDGSMPTGTLEAGPDASDASADVVEEPSPPQVVQVQVTNNAGREEGVTIVFSDATGALITTGVTDSNGTIVQQLATGSQVTALLGTTDAPNLLTVAGVKPGDILQLIDGPLASEDTAQVTFNAYSQADASVSTYLASSGGCSNISTGAATEVDYGLNPGCANPSGQFPVLVEAKTSDNETLAWESGKGHVPTTDAGAAPVALTSATWSTTLGTETITVVNVPDTLAPSAAFTEYVSGVPYALTTFPQTPVDAGVYQATLPIHPGFGDFDQVEVQYGLTQTHGGSQLAIADRVNATTTASPSAGDSIDVTDTLPAITGVSADATNPLQPKFAWTSAAPLSTAAATFVQLQWNDPIDDAGDLKTGNWTIIVPGGQMSVVPPQIPGASGLGPCATSTWPDYIPILVSMNGDAFPTYDAIRATAAQIGTNLNSSNNPLLPPLPANGRARASVFFPF